MRNLFTKHTVKGLSAAEGYLELDLPQRALGALDRIADAGMLKPYCQYLRGQALKKLDRYDEAIEVLQDAARTMPAPVNRKVWEDLSQCFRHQGLDELADVADVFAEDPIGGADQDFENGMLDDFLPETASEFWAGEEPEGESRNRSGAFLADDFQDYNFEDDDYQFGYDFDEDPNPSKHKPPQK